MTSIEALTITMMTKMATSLSLTPDVQAKARSIAASKVPAMNSENKKLALNQQLKEVF